MPKEQKAFNPVEYKNDFMQLATQRPDEAAEVALKWRERFMNQNERRSNMNENLAYTGVMVLSGVVAGGLEGKNEAIRDALIKDWVEIGHTGVDEDGNVLFDEVSLEDYPEPWDHPNGKRNPMSWTGLVPNGKTFLVTVITGLGGALGTRLWGERVSNVMLATAKGTGTVWAAGMARSYFKARKAKALANKAEEGDEGTE